MQQNWNNAKSRKVFRWHLLLFLVSAVIFWLIWWVMHDANAKAEGKYFPWPVWPLLIWLMGLIIHFRAVYGKRKELPRGYHSQSEEKQPKPNK